MQYREYQIRYCLNNNELYSIINPLYFTNKIGKNHFK